MSLDIFYATSFTIALTGFIVYVLPKIKSEVSLTFYREKALRDENRKFTKDLVSAYKDVKKQITSKDEFEKSYNMATEKLLSDCKFEYYKKLKRELKSMHVNFGQQFAWFSLLARKKTIDQFLQELVASTGYLVKEENLENKEFDYVIRLINNAK